MATTKFIESGTSATGGLEFFSSSSGTVTSDTTVSRNGNPRSLKLNTSNPAVNAIAVKAAIMADAGRRVSFWIRLPSVAPSGIAAIANVQQVGAAATCISIQLLTTGKLRLVANSAVSNTIADSTTVLQANVWYRVSFAYTITNLNVNEYRLFINGTLEATISNAAVVNVTTERIGFLIAAAAGIDFVANYSDIYVDDGTDLADPGNISVTCKLPAADNTVNFNHVTGATSDPGAGLRYTMVNERPISTTAGRQHRIPSFQANGALATNATTTTLPLVAPTLLANEIMVASIYGNNNQVVSAPDGTWTSIKEVNNGTGMRTSIFAKRAALTDSGATFNFTKPVDDNLLFAGLISTWAGPPRSGAFLDATAASSSANALADAVTYATYDPTETLAFVIAAGQYGNDLTTAGAISGTDPTYTNRTDVETTVGNDCSIFNYDGASSGAATGARSHATTSTADAVNTGVQFGLTCDAQENYTLQAAGVGDQNIADGTIVARTAWVWAKANTGGLGQPKIMDNGTESNVTLTTSYALYTVTTDSASYPSNAAGIGMRSGTNTDAVLLGECGTIIAYIPRVAAPGPFHRSQRFFRKVA